MADPRKPRKLPRRMTAERIENVALHYLSRYASSSGNLRRVLMRRVERAAAAHDDDPAAGAELVDALIARFLRSGLIDDRAYAAQKAASLRRRGTSRFGIRGKLRQKGVGADLVNETVAQLDGGGSDAGEFAAACALVLRRRLGPCRSAGQRAAMRQKDLATLARAGFGLAVAHRALSAPDSATLEVWIRGEAQMPD
ncbi:MAG: RecX family transcriptional regulator [Alphaproteobacteria bacterium]|nr:RecX family transcriptional regulator [Alphaproteobacteria bacterium]